MEVVGSDEQHVGTVDRVAGDRIILTRSDPESGGVHHSLSCADVDRIEDDRVILDCNAEKARERWRDERSQPRAVRARGPGPRRPANPRPQLLRHLPLRSIHPFRGRGLARSRFRCGRAFLVRARALMRVSKRENENGARLAPDEPPAGASHRREFRAEGNRAAAARRTAWSASATAGCRSIPTCAAG